MSLLTIQSKLFDPVPKVDRLDQLASHFANAFRVAHSILGDQFGLFYMLLVDRARGHIVVIDRLPPRGPIPFTNAVRHMVTQNVYTLQSDKLFGLGLVSDDDKQACHMSRKMLSHMS